MANSTTREPQDTGVLASYASPLDELLRGFFVRPVSFGPREWHAAQFRMDVYETENAYRLVADLPGVRKEDIDVTIVGPEVSISAEVKSQPAAENEKALLVERAATKYHRALTLGCEIDQSNAQARYVDGILELTLPKSADAMPNKIAVH